MSSAFVRDALEQRAVVRDEYELLLLSAFDRAEEACRGSLLNRRGLAKGIDPVRLFKSNAAFAYAYASEELIEHWRSHPRPTFAAYEAQRFRSWDMQAVS